MRATPRRSRRRPLSDAASASRARRERAPDTFSTGSPAAAGFRPWQGADTIVRAIIHIGGEKTGTSSIQAFCTKNRGAMAEQGILYPASLGASNHLRLTAYALDDDADDDTRRSLNLADRDQIGEFRKQVLADLSREIAATPDISTLLLSDEHLQSRLLKVSEVRRLARLVGRHANRITILLYIRRQDRVAVSYYSTRLKSDSFADDVVFPAVPKRGPLPKYYDYDALLARYEKVFGAQNITVRIFDPARFVDGDLLRDFQDACGISGSPAFVPVARENESLSEIGIRFYKRFNSVVPRFVQGRVNPYRHGVEVAIMKRYAGAGPRVSGADARRFHARFAASNRAVQVRYFPGEDAPLFDEDFTHYDRERAPAPGEDELLDLAVHLWVERTAAIEVLRIENALMRFQAAIRDDPVAPPPALPEISLDPALPSRLTLRYLGALLYAGSFRKAADMTAILLAGETEGPLVLLVHACALGGLGDRAALERLLTDRPLAPKLRVGLETIAGAELAGRAASWWLEFFRSGAMAHTPVYSRCLRWLDV
jgi:hypothetical protein